MAEDNGQLSIDEIKAEDLTPEKEEEIFEPKKHKVSMNMDDLTFGELEVFENVTGLVMSEAVRTVIVTDPATGRPLPDPEDPKGRPLKETRMSVKAMMGMVYIAMLRENPDVSFNEVRSLKMSDIEMEVLEGDEGKDES